MNMDYIGAPAKARHTINLRHWNVLAHALKVVAIVLKSKHVISLWH